MKQQCLELIQEDPTRVNAFFGFLQNPKKVSALAGIMSKKHWVQELIQEETHVLIYLYWYNSCQNTPAF